MVSSFTIILPAAFIPFCFGIFSDSAVSVEASFGTIGFTEDAWETQASVPIMPSVLVAVFVFLGRGVEHTLPKKSMMDSSTGASSCPLFEAES